ncbi:serine/threonine-protein kinase [Nocardia macrotermitis]|uniref:Serine/threonine-protein kinase PknD n=1 Tax=Nocardia macrotermitis TaxID=2585198 RepID=A0A7K0DF37_9NOCA|nr:serine/threonine-protein kinase [Nocardia macrotermitis]MQY23902.1 Serine/threonine-protein kinase PknD [Nocardia macrotermitis]
MFARLLREGQRIGETYEVERFLGEGAFAEVYRVRHRILGRQAMKVFRRTGTARENDAMLGEAILLSQMGHPNIIRVFDANTVSTPQGERAYFTMEYIAGGNLQNFWTSHRDRFVPLSDSARILHQISEGLAVAHTAQPPIIHRDITPQNILVGYDPAGLRARISDFGLAKHINPLTQLASTRGTLAFKSPESLLNPNGDSRAGDVWAIGTIAYLLLTDTLPYPEDFREAGLAVEFFGTQRREPPRPPHELNAEVDRELDRIVLAALDPDPAARTPDAGVLAAQFGRWRARTSSEPFEHVRTDLTQHTSKTVLGNRSPGDEQAAETLAERALRLARQAATLPEAADVMEEAFGRLPRLRDVHESRLRLWRKGVVT